DLLRLPAQPLLERRDLALEVEMRAVGEPLQLGDLLLHLEERALEGETVLDLLGLGVGQGRLLATGSVAANGRGSRRSGPEPCRATPGCWKSRGARASSAHGCVARRDRGSRGPAGPGRHRGTACPGARRTARRGPG